MDEHGHSALTSCPVPSQLPRAVRAFSLPRPSNCLCTSINNGPHIRSYITTELIIILLSNAIEINWAFWPHLAQAVSRELPTAAARVCARVWSHGICGGQRGAGIGIL
jgi:hypothetical protein